MCVDKLITGKVGRFVIQILVSTVVSIPACHAGDRGSIPRRGEREIFLFLTMMM